MSDAQGLALASLALALSSAGFLVWNWPPAKIFMGDAGSGLLGYSFAVLALAGAQSGAMPAWIWLILLAPFVLDATLTLLRRMLRGERWYQAHATHLYQRMVQSGYSHKQVAGRDNIKRRAVMGVGCLAVAACGVRRLDCVPDGHDWNGGVDLFTGQSRHR